MRKCFFFILLIFLGWLGLSQPVSADDVVRTEVFDFQLGAGKKLEHHGPFSFQAFAASEVDGVQVSFLQVGGWTDWRDLSYEEEELSGSELMFVEPSQAFSLRSERALNVKVTLMDFSPQPLLVASSQPEYLAVVTKSKTRIISRATWGAEDAVAAARAVEESGVGEHESEAMAPAPNLCAPLERKYPDQFRQQTRKETLDQLGRALIWPREYSEQIKKIVIHHTAREVRDFNGDSRVDEQDFKIGVQAIYQYHTVSRGWGDLGYHFLVDPFGNIYEGRAGGAYVVGAHVLCQNTSTVGVALMGNFQTERVPQQGFQGVVDIVRYLTELYNINSKGESQFRGAIIPHIVSHGEIAAITKGVIGQGATQCPGRNLRRMMTELRTEVAREAEFSQVVKPEFRYELTALESGDRVLLTGERRTIKVTIKNTGNFPWMTEGESALALRQVQRLGARLLPVKGGINLPVAKKIAVSGTAVFSVDLPVYQRRGVISIELAPMAGEGQNLRGERILLHFTVEAPKFVARVEPAIGQQALVRGFEQELRMMIVNRSNFDWQAGMIWYSVRGLDRVFIDREVMVGENFSFPVPVKVGYKDGQVEVKGLVGIDALPIGVESRGFRPSKAAFSETIKTGGRVQLVFEKEAQSVTELSPVVGEQEVWVQYRNAGSVPWYRDGAYRARLQIQDKPDFLHPSWQQRKFAGFLQQEVVMPGESGRFVLQLNVRKIPLRSESDVFVPVVEGILVRTSDKAEFTLSGQRDSGREAVRPVVRPTSVRPSPAVEGPKPAELPPMRVLLTEINQDLLEVTSTGEFSSWDSRSQQTRENDPGEIVQVSRDQLRGGIIFRVQAKEQPQINLLNWNRFKNFGSTIYNDNSFRNVLEFRLDGDRMIVINELPLADYMKGIAEEPETEDIPQEKRKVIAVLARSYALHYLTSGYEKFPGKPYNAADSPAIFQKYLGYGFESRSPKWQKAVRETKDEVVMAGDSVIRAAYFSCTDGARTKSAAEVWPDVEYFQRNSSVFQSVPDPFGDDPTRSGFEACGHQVGLSGYGTTQMAKEGKTYREIIQYYYQGVEIKKTLP
ncbi:MAG: N-acetylmuramoyl-L-alanine amidase [bacterium]|nr:N-acetylmuramoyl-L-alanine amidase [bacterium]